MLFASLLIGEPIGTYEYYGVVLYVLRLELAAPNHGELLLVYALKELARRFVIWILWYKLAANGKVQELLSYCFSIH